MGFGGTARQGIKNRLELFGDTLLHGLNIALNRRVPNTRTDWEQEITSTPKTL